MVYIYRGAGFTELLQTSRIRRCDGPSSTHLKCHSATLQNNLHEEIEMKLSSSYSSAGRVIFIETDEELDLTSHGVFVDACRLAEYPDCSSIDVNLIKTRNIRASGVAMLLMLRQLTDRSCNRIRLLNCHPNVRNYLMKSKLGQQFQVV
jgi:hypothetical protein